MMKKKIHLMNVIILKTNFGVTLKINIIPGNYI